MGFLHIGQNVMVNDRLRVVSLSTFDIKGADHLGLVAQIALS